MLVNTIISATLIALISVDRLCRGWLSPSGINPSGAIQLQNKEEQIIEIILDISIIHYILLKARAQRAYRQMQNMYTHNYVKQIIVIIYPLTARVVGAPQMIFTTSFLSFSLFSTALWDLPNSRPVHFLMLSSHLVLCLPCPLPLPNSRPVHSLMLSSHLFLCLPWLLPCALQDGFGFGQT